MKLMIIRAVSYTHLRESDVENLCHLAYWLYVYGCEDEALKLCEITHEVEFPGKGVWKMCIRDSCQ